MRLCLVLATISLLAACGSNTGYTRHDLDPTQGEVKFARHRKGFYEQHWFRQAKATQPKICAGFVHRETFARVMKYGQFELEMTLEVFKGGQPQVEGGRVTGWTGGTLLRTIKKRRKVSPSNNAYVWCGRLQKGGTWKVGALRFNFDLRGPERAMDEHLATGVLQIVP